MEVEFSAASSMIKSASGVQPVKKIEPPKYVNSYSNATKERCLTGDVGEIIEFNKKHPDLNAFYEVYAKVFKVTAKEHQKVLLLRNNSGRILQAIFSEIDVKMDDLKPGDSVRAVGKFKNNSYLNIFKIRAVSDDDNSYVRRLSSIGSFALKNSLK